MGIGVTQLLYAKLKVYCRTCVTRLRLHKVNCRAWALVVSLLAHNSLMVDVGLLKGKYHCQDGLSYKQLDFCNHSIEYNSKQGQFTSLIRDSCFNLFVCFMACGCYCALSLLHGTVVLSALCDCEIWVTNT